MKTNQISADEHLSVVLANISRSITEYAPLPMATVEGEHHVVRYANPVFCRLLGKPVENVVGRPLVESMPENDDCLKQMDLVYRMGRSVLRMEQGNVLPQSLFQVYSLWPVMVDQLAVGVMIQVAERESIHGQHLSMNEELMHGFGHQHELAEMSDTLNLQLRREIEERSKIQQTLSERVRLLDLSNDAIIVLDLEHHIRFWNHGAEELYGWSREEALGQVSHALFHTAYPHSFEQIKEELYRNNQWTGELTHTKRDGQRITVLVRKVLDRDSHGNAVAILESMTDITERSKAVEALRKAQTLLADRAQHLEELVAERTSELIETNKQMEMFVYSIAHDLRAPLHSMQGFSELLVGDKGSSLSETGLAYARRVDKSAQFMDSLLSDLLAFSRTSQGHVVLKPIGLDLVLKSVASRFGKDMKEAGARLDNAGPWPVVLAHESTLAQVLYNLMSNSFKFVEPGVSPLVRLWTEEKGAFVRLWVGDNGPGIAPEYHEQIFRPFTRLAGDKHPGTGIGLAIVQKGVERMGGRVGLESALGQGSRFWLELRKA